MLYTDLDKIPLSIFIEVFTGNINSVVINGVHSKDEIKEASEKLIMDYVQIVGGMSALAEITKKNNILNNQTKIECMQACENLIKLGEWEDVCSILSTLGYKMFPNQRDQIKKRIQTVLSGSKYRIDRLMADQKDKQDVKIDRNYFTKERVLIMTHYSMHINPEQFSAKEYAYMVKRMCDDVASMARYNKRK